MTNEERDIITRFIERVGGAPSASFGSVPGAAPPLPPIDREADALIGELFAKYPEARYRLTQTAFVQEHALAEARTGSSGSNTSSSRPRRRCRKWRRSSRARAAP